MDSAYDAKEAAEQLEIHAMERLNSPHSGLQMSRIASVTARYEVTATGQSGQVRRLVHKATDGMAVCEEVTALFQGIICKHDLPPITEKVRGAQARYLRQSVTITGLRTPTFDKIVRNTAEIHAVLGRAVGIDKIEDCGIITSYQGMPALESSNRYFTPRSSTMDSAEVAFSADVDPHGHLTQAAGTGLYHSEENEVAYFIRDGTTDENYKYSPASPVIFGVGDIIEVQVSFMTIPLKEGRSRSMMVLRGLTLIDGKFTLEARVRQLTMRSNIKVQAPRMTLKRRVGYHEEEVSVARAKMGRMEIDPDIDADDKGAENLGKKKTD